MNKVLTENSISQETISKNLSEIILLAAAMKKLYIVSDGDHPFFGGTIWQWGRQEAIQSIKRVGPINGEMVGDIGLTSLDKNVTQICY